MDPIKKPNPSSAPHSPISNEVSPSPNKRKINEVSKGALLPDPTAKIPSILERIVKSSSDLSNLEFVKSLIIRCAVSFPFALTVEDLLRIEKINEIYKSPPTDGSSTDKETFTSLSTLYENEDFFKEISRHDLKNIQDDKKSFDKIKKLKKLSLENINNLLKIYFNQTLKKCQLYESSQSLMTEFYTYIDSLAFKNSILAKLDDVQNGINQMTLEKIMKLPLVDKAFEKSLELRFEKFVEIENQIHLDFIINLKFDELFEMFIADTDYFMTMNGKQLTKNDALVIFDKFSFDFCEHLEILIEGVDPIKAIYFLQKLKVEAEEEDLELSENIIDIEITTAERLFSSKQDAENGISQLNFKDEELGIGVGGANYCCGSISVEALVSKLKGKPIQEVIKNGVIRHLTLPKEQMRRLTNISMLLEANKDIRSDSSPIKESIDLTAILYSRYLNFLNQIPKGFSGLLLANNAFIMYSENVDDGSIEIFDSHGSSIPLITGVTHPAYRAFFKDKENAAAYLSVHRKSDIDKVLSFYPVEVVSS